jgi:hypothetical protein
MLRFDNYHLSLNAMGLFASIVAFALLYKFFKRDFDRNLVITLSSVWIALWTVEFWVLGSKSYIHYNALNAGFSTNLLFSNFKWDQIYSHIPAGGMDLLAASQIAGGYLSLEKVIVSLFPTWLANAFHQILVASIAFCGVYKSCRSQPIFCPRNISFSLAALFTYSQTEILESSWNHGLGYAFIPMACYLLIQRYGRRYYWPGVFGASVVIAVSSSPTHSELALSMSLLCVAILMKPGRIWVFVPAVLVHLLFVVANWHESIYAKFLLAPLSERGNTAGGFTQYSDSTIFYLLAAIGILQLAFAQKFKAFIPLIAFTMSMWFWIPISWATTHFAELSSLRAVTLGRMSISGPFIAILVFSMACRTVMADGLGKFLIFNVDRRRWVHYCFLILAAASIGTLVWFKAYNISTWLRNGGLSPQTRLVKDISDRPWEGDQRVRTATFSFRIAEFAPAAAGVDTLSGTLNIAPSNLSKYWDEILSPHKSDALNGYLRIQRPDLDFYCCLEYEIAKYADLDLLRIANVGFIYSFLPLVGSGIQQVAGPLGETQIPRASDSIWVKLNGYLKQIFDHDGVRVYALKSPLPRVFAAQGIKAVDADLDDDSLFRQVRKNAIKRVAIVNAENAPSKINAYSSMSVKNYTLLSNRVEVDVQAPDGGLLIFNTPYIPFWSASADGKKIKSFAANGVHTAVSVPAGAREIVLRYDRPLIRGLIEKYIKKYSP